MTIAQLLLGFCLLMFLIALMFGLMMVALPRGRVLRGIVAFCALSVAYLFLFHSDPWVRADMHEEFIRWLALLS